jgi:ATP-dependent Lhr-like helicase
VAAPPTALSPPSRSLRLVSGPVQREGDASNRDGLHGGASLVDQRDLGELLHLDERRRAEVAFAQGSDCVIVATSTLELGIDVGDLDRVIQIDAPGSVASFLQRLGRTGRRAGTLRNCLFLTTSDAALLRAAGLLELWGQGHVEPIVALPLPYHLLAQQLMALCLQTGGLPRGEWRAWLGELPCFATMGETAERVVVHMLEVGILSEDQGVLGLGPEGERLYGRRNFLELYSIFATPPLFTVLHGKDEIGLVHETSFQSGAKGEAPRPVVLLLGGRSWAVRALDLSGRRAWVEPTDDVGRSRWCGSSRPLSFAHARAIRRVLVGIDPPGQLSQRAKDALAAARLEFPWVDDASCALVCEARAMRLWTFAGLRVNLLLAARLRDLLASATVRDDLSIELKPGVDPEAVRLRLTGGSPDVTVSTAADDDAKFGDSVPADLLLVMRAARHAVPEVAEVLAERLRVVAG